jgi:hypothetical protein
MDLSMKGTKVARFNAFPREAALDAVAKSLSLAV